LRGDRRVSVGGSLDDPRLSTSRPTNVHTRDRLAPVDARFAQQSDLLGTTSLVGGGLIAGDALRPSGRHGALPHNDKGFAAMPILLLFASPQVQCP